MKAIITPERAAILGKVAVIADLHLGFEGAMRKAGVAFPRVQIEEIKKRVDRILKRGVEKIVVAGDLKHEFTENLPHEWKDIEEFLKFLDERGAEVILVRGNHDSYLRAIAKKFGAEVLDEFEVRGIKIVHGHKECEGKRIVMGHEHPSVKLRVRGGMYSYPCFLRLKDVKNSRDVLVLPAMSPLLSGSDVLSLESFLSPILKNFSPREAEVYAIYEDQKECGVFSLGKVEDLVRVLE